MQLILLKKVAKLGMIGDIVNVKLGYARNYLLPKQYAIRATKENVARFENEKLQVEADNLKAKNDAIKVAEKIDNLATTLIRQAGEAGHLYGSVSAKDIANSLHEQHNITIHKSQIKLNHPIKELGISRIELHLHPEVSAYIILNVARSDGEAQEQLATHQKEQEQALSQATS